MRRLPRARADRAWVADLLASLVRTPSPSGHEGPVGRVLATTLRRAGLAVRRQPVRPRTANILARVGGGFPRVVFVTHLDTVTPDPARWRITAPWTPRRSGDRLYGLGATDAKGVAAALALLLRRLAAHPPARGSVEVGFVVEEETSGHGSAVYARSLPRGRPVTVLIGEPTAKTVVVGSRGSTFLELRVVGEPRHSAYRQTRTDPLRALPALAVFARRLAAAGRHPLLAPAVTVTSLAAGLAVRNGVATAQSNNTAPGTLILTLDIRTTPALEQGGFRVLRRELATLVRQLRPLRVTSRVLAPPTASHVLGPAHPLVRAARASVRAVTGRPARVRTTPGTNDAPFFARRGFPTLTEIGPGDPDVIHRPDEHVSLRDVLTGAAIYEDLARRLLVSGAAAKEKPGHGR